MLSFVSMREETQVVHWRLPVTIVTGLKRFAEKEERTLVDAVRRLLKQALGKKR